ncbi:MAG: KTSC domain-containing protein [Pseudomonadota bacterium]
MSEKTKSPTVPVISMKPVKSSNISHTGYDAASKTLAVTFSSGATYHYPDVGPDVFEKMGKAKSVGGFFASDIRNKFTGTKQPAAKK